jgi:hypothetical protein
MNNVMHSQFPESISEKIPITNQNYNDQIIKQPQPNIKKGRDNFRFIIDSRDRDYKLYPNPNNYVINFTNELRDVISVELVKGCIPNSQYQINHTNNILSYIKYNELENECVEKSIEKGNYTVSELIDELNLIQNDLIFTHNLKKNKVIIYNNTEHNIIFLFSNYDVNNKCNNSDKKIAYKKYNYVNNIKQDGGTIAQVLGFLPFNYKLLSKSNDNYKELFAPNIINLNSCKYVILAIPEMEKNKSNTDSITSSYSIIPFDCGASCALINASNSANMDETKHFNPPKAKFTKLTIKFLNYDGSLYDFNGVDHILDFKVYALNYKDIYI